MRALFMVTILAATVVIAIVYFGGIGLTNGVVKIEQARTQRAAEVTKAKRISESEYSERVRLRETAKTDLARLQAEVTTMTTQIREHELTLRQQVHENEVTRRMALTAETHIAELVLTGSRNGLSGLTVIAIVGSFVVVLLLAVLCIIIVRRLFMMERVVYHYLGPARERLPAPQEEQPFYTVVNQNALQRYRD